MIVTAVTRKDSISDYLAFSAKIVEKGVTSCKSNAFIISVEQRDATWIANRLLSGNIGASIVDDLDAWKKEWGYEKTAVNN